MTKNHSTERYTTAAGEVIEYPTPPPDVSAYLGRVLEAAHEPRVSESELIELVYSTENPIMDTSLMPGRGAVTKEVFANPVYHVMHDALFAKRLQMEHAASAGTVVRGLSVAEAAEQLEMSPSAVRQAIRRGDLEATKVKGAHSIEPASVLTYRSRVKRRGPAREPMLRIRQGNEPGRSFRVKVLGDLRMTGKDKLPGGGYVVHAEVPEFSAAIVAFSGKKTNRSFKIEPADKPNSFDFGSFGIEGRYRVVEKVNDPQRASETFRAFEASPATLRAEGER